MHSTYVPSPPPPPAADAPQPPSLLSGLGQALRWLREKQTRKQYRVADDAGITKGMLSAYETGRQRPSLETLEKLLETLGCDLNDLHNALQLVNGRPERIKSWRGWQTTGWQPANGALAPGLAPAPLSGRPAGAAERPPNLGPLPPSWPSAPSYSSFPSYRGAMEIRESPAPPYGADRPGAEEPLGAAGMGRAGGIVPQGPSELSRVLGQDQPRLAHEEEQALGQMLEGFHNLLRYWHRALAAMPGAAPAYPVPAPRAQTAQDGPHGPPAFPGSAGSAGSEHPQRSQGSPGSASPEHSQRSQGSAGSAGSAGSEHPQRSQGSPGSPGSERHPGSQGSGAPHASPGPTGSDPAGPAGSAGPASPGAPGRTPPGGKR